MDLDDGSANQVADQIADNRCKMDMMDLDLSYLSLDEMPSHYLRSDACGFDSACVKSLMLDHNQILQLPQEISIFVNLVALDISNNQVNQLPDTITQLVSLRVLIAKSNLLDSCSFPKQLSTLLQLEVLNVSGNQIEELPNSLLTLPSLKALYLGGNRLQTLPCRVGEMESLEHLYLGGNRLKDIPATIGQLRNLQSLVLCENSLETIPSTIAQLQKLRSLSLHKNQLRTLPPEIVTLRDLQELSLRSNPLVGRFVRDMSFDPPSLKELAGRVVQIKRLAFGPYDLPQTLINYLVSAHQCVNPQCKGVYFDARVEHVKFVDFCGKYRVPLMQYLCTPQCSTAPAYELTTESSEEDETEDGTKLRKVLLG